MDPVAAIVGALTTAVVNLAEPAVNDAYNGLKALIKRRFNNDPVVQVTMDNLEDEEKLERNGQVLQSSLEGTDVGQDQEILAALQELEAKLQDTYQAGRLTVSQTLTNEQNARITGAKLDSVDDLKGQGLDIKQSAKGGSGTVMIGLQTGGKKDDDV